MIIPADHAASHQIIFVCAPLFPGVRFAPVETTTQKQRFLCGLTQCPLCANNGQRALPQKQLFDHLVGAA